MSVIFQSEMSRSARCARAAAAAATNPSDANRATVVAQLAERVAGTASHQAPDPAIYFAWVAVQNDGSHYTIGALNPATSTFGPLVYSGRATPIVIEAFEKIARAHGLQMRLPVRLIELVESRVAKEVPV